MGDLVWAIVAVLVGRRDVFDPDTGPLDRRGAFGRGTNQLSETSLDPAVHRVADPDPVVGDTTPGSTYDVHAPLPVRALVRADGSAESRRTRAAGESRRTRETGVGEC